MEILLQLGIFVLSLAVLLKASDWFVEAAEKVGLALGISPFIIGVTIVALGTSLPELATSIAAVFSGNPENTSIVVGNVIGSNIANICLVLAAIAIVGKKVKLNFDIVVVDMPLLISSAFLMWFILQPDATGTSSVSIFEAILLLTGLVIYLLYTFSNSGSEDRDPDFKREKIELKTIGILVLSSALIYGGATFTIQAVENLAELLNIKSESLALSLIALGTSLPEIIVSISATRKGNAEMGIGNVLGSNVFNTFAVMGIPSLMADLTISQDILDFSLPMMIAATFLFFFMLVSKIISRWEGLMLLLFYAYFLAYIFGVV